ncbi:hypothetical protein RF11_08252 [Thelohanellus kitauei]|uniref:Uncharacterized protein n=1 Tax=Thelohanellus kitauei TaxID=669202 RepID=A0A0C2N216_THEKT|nr:hypothetical protein RF11_08252 [Thelohanellus kitauei]
MDKNHHARPVFEYPEDGRFPRIRILVVDSRKPVSMTISAIRDLNFILCTSADLDSRFAFRILRDLLDSSKELGCVTVSAIPLRHRSTTAVYRRVLELYLNMLML